MTAAQPLKLTTRQREVMALVADGMTDGEVAEAMGLTHSTVRTYVQSAMKANGAPTRVALAVWIEREAQAEALAGRA